MKNRYKYLFLGGLVSASFFVFANTSAYVSALSKLEDKYYFHGVDYSNDVDVLMENHRDECYKEGLFNYCIHEIFHGIGEDIAREDFKKRFGKIV